MNEVSNVSVVNGVTNVATDNAGITYTDGIPSDIDDYILIFRHNCELTNQLLQIAHPDIQFICKENYVDEQLEKNGTPVKVALQDIIDGKKQLYYCRRSTYATDYPDNENLKIYEYSSENKFKEIPFYKYNNGYGVNPRIGEFIKRSERVDYPDNIPRKPDSLKLSEDDRKTYFNKMITAYKNARDKLTTDTTKTNGFRMHWGGKKQSKRKRKSTKKSKRRRDTRKRTNKKR